MGRLRGGRWRLRPRRCQARAPADRAAIPWALELPTMMPTPPSQVRQNYRLECEAALNSHAALEFHASFQCLALAFYLDRDDVALKHFHRFFPVQRTAPQNGACQGTEAAVCGGGA